VNLREAELELFGVIRRFEIHHASLDEFALAVLLREYVRLKRATTLSRPPDLRWTPPLEIPGVTDVEDEENDDE
jgi:hypothetical protein